MPIRKKVKVQVEFDVPESQIDDQFSVGSFNRFFTSRNGVKNLSISNAEVTMFKVPTVKSQKIRSLNEYKRIITPIVKTLPYEIIVKGMGFSDRSVICLNMKPIRLTHHRWERIDVVSCVCKNSIITLEGRYFFRKSEELVVNLADPNALELLTSGITQNVEKHAIETRANGGSPSFSVS